MIVFLIFLIISLSYCQVVVPYLNESIKLSSTIPMSNFNNIGPIASDCSLAVDHSIIISCKNGKSLIDQMENLE